MINAPRPKPSALHPTANQLQLTKSGKLKHFLTLEGLKKDILESILNDTKRFISVQNQSAKKVPLLQGKTIVNLFFENSTRTRTTFELSAVRLSADVLNLDINTSATSKGESLIDTLKNLQAMNCDMFIVRHSSSGAAEFIATHIGEHISIINAGDGQHAHPTQAMLDLYTIHHFKGAFEKLKVAIVGDILHSRVARSLIHGLSIMGTAEIRTIGPRTLMPRQVEKMGVHYCEDMDKGIKGCDVVIMLRLQKERMDSAFIPSEAEYYKRFGLTTRRLKLAHKDAIVMHPGPTNRGVEISATVADGPQSVILDQVNFGVAVRMAILAQTLGNICQQEAG